MESEGGTERETEWEQQRKVREKKQKRNGTK